MALKQAIFAEIEAAAPASAILCSNTSVMPITQIMAGLADKARARALSAKPAMICVIGMTEVLEHKIAEAGAAASISAKIACFSAIFSGAASKTKAAS